MARERKAVAKKENPELVALISAATELNEVLGLGPNDEGGDDSIIVSDWGGAQVGDTEYEADEDGHIQYLKDQITEAAEIVMWPGNAENKDPDDLTEETVTTMAEICEIKEAIDIIDAPPAEEPPPKPAKPAKPAKEVAKPAKEVAKPAKEEEPKKEDGRKKNKGNAAALIPRVMSMDGALCRIYKAVLEHDNTDLKEGTVCKPKDIRGSATLKDITDSTLAIGVGDVKRLLFVCKNVGITMK